jgi:hypothetical protein
MIAQLDLVPRDEPKPVAQRKRRQAAATRRTKRGA